jgi:hypothetical protein
MRNVRVDIETLWVDTDSMLELRITVHALGFVCWHEAYTYPDAVQSFANELQSFPRTATAEVALRTGAIDPAGDSMTLRAFTTDGAGHAALEFVGNTVGTPLVTRQFRFAAPVEAASLNELGRSLAQWNPIGKVPFTFEAYGA